MDGRATRPPDVSPDTVLGGRFRLVHERAAHAHTALWQGRDEVLSRPVAVRIFHLDDAVGLTADGLRSAVADASRVSDGRFARILDVGDEETSDGSLGWVVSEWIDAPSLAAVLRDGPLPAAEAADLVAEVAAALAAAARVGVHHGGLHPGNVLLPGSGVVKVADLHVAAVATGRDVADGDRDDARALGALLYAAVTATWPDGRLAGLPAAPREGAAPCTPRQVRAGVPREIDSIASRALGTGPTLGRPYASAAEIAHALAAVPRRPYGAPADIPDGTTAGRRRAQLMTVLTWAVPIALVALAGIGGWVVGSAVGHVPGADNRVPSYTQPTPSDSTGAALNPVWRTPPDIRSFDPEGDGEEDPDEVTLAVDGDPSTVWRTDRYRRDPQFGRLKTGVGLLIDLRRPVTVREARILATPGISLQLRAADAPKAAASDFTLVKEAANTGGAVTLRPDRPVTARYWLVWITRLVPDNGGFRASIAEVSLLG